MRTKITLFSMRNLLMVLTLSFLLFTQLSHAQSSMTVDVSAAKIKSPKLVTSENGAKINLSDAGGAIKNLAVSGTVLFKKNNSYARIILVDKFGNEYLVYDANGVTVDGASASFNNIGEETFSLSSVIPAFLRIDINEATLTLNEVFFTPASVKRSLKGEAVPADTIRFRQAKDKAAQMNAQIKKKGLKWVAGVTPISLLSYEEKKRLFKGSLPNLQGAEYYTGGIFEIPSATAQGTSISTSATAPGASPFVSEFDWRNRHGQHWLTSVKDQGGCGSCWAFAATATTEQLVNLYYNRHLNLNLSEQEILSCSGAGDCSGGWPHLALDYIASKGVVNDGCFTYAATELACSLKCASPTERIKIKGRKDFTSANEDSLKAMIIKGPVSGGIFSWSHALNLVGYKKIAAGDKVAVGSSHSHITIAAGDPLIGRTMWIFKNSWGASWGNSGYLYLVTDIADIGWTHSAYGPVTSPNYTTANIQCTDADGDGFYFWGVGPKPAHCPASPALADGDDSNPNLGPMNAYGVCQTNFSLSSIVLTPSTGATLLTNGRVNITFNYANKTNKNLRIYAQPMYKGNFASYGAYAGSPLYTAPSGSATGFITLTQPGNVDQIRFRIYDAANNTTLLYEKFVTVSYKFVNYLISGVKLTPASPATVVTNSDINISFNYLQSTTTGVRIYARPMYMGSLAPNYGASGSPLYTASSGSGTGFFRISKPGAVDQIRFSIYASDNTTLLYEYFVKVNYKIVNPARDGAFESTLEIADFEVSPVPADEYFNIRNNTSNEYIYQLMNSLGTVVKEGKSSDLETQVDVAGATPGMYILRLYNGDDITEKKIIVQ